MQPERPFACAEILQALTSVEAEVTRFFGSLSDEEVSSRQGKAWTPAEHLVHLNISVNAVARGLSISSWLLSLRFGRTRVPSRTYEEIHRIYRVRLAEGAGATGPYVPPQEELVGEAVASRRSEILARWQRVNARLRTAQEGWSERQLDRVRLPHPLLGKLTVREMLFFTLYHNQHHIAASKRRLPRFGSEPLTG
ncbi:MAG: DinB family protein [Gemmatimonadetes bacterium]|nr:DinB family protein [Gemmatimonadota bacterium]